MGKWHGKVGYVKSVETAPGVWNPEVTEKPHSGDLLSNTNQWVNSGNVNDDIQVANKISMIANPFAQQNFQFIRYAEFMGTMWAVTTVEYQHPRIILTLGGVWNGAQAGIADQT